MNGTPLLPLLRLASPALPIGAFAYSQGLESAVAAGWVHDEASAQDWVLGVLVAGLGRIDVPLLARLQAAFTARDAHAAHRWVAWLFALRGSKELQDEERRLGTALLKVLTTLDATDAWPSGLRPSHLAAFALGAAHCGASASDAAASFAFAWVENQVAAALRLCSIGQSSGLRLVARAMEQIPKVVGAGLALDDDEIGVTTPLPALASAWHETQYSRIFRS